MTEAKSVAATKEVADAISAYVELRQQKKLIDAKMLEKRAVVEAFLGDREKLLSEDGSRSLASWAYGSDVSVVDYESVLRELKKKFGIDDTSMKLIVDEHTTVKRGPRTFRV